ncbi:hypothetical protein [Ensifer canadensis]|uniref:hypothetical protein n=1 Tax=Ensifer canadensis TaxID=555315 RepID=UPI0035E3D9E6
MVELNPQLRKFVESISTAQKEQRERAETKMPAAAFNRWIDEMKVAGLARSDAECARLLGVSANAMVTLKKNGSDRRTALACRALLHRMAPFD